MPAVNEIPGEGNMWYAGADGFYDDDPANRPADLGASPVAAGGLTDEFEREKSGMLPNIDTRMAVDRLRQLAHGTLALAVIAVAAYVGVSSLKKK
jgi:hypothetical protein